MPSRAIRQTAAERMRGFALEEIPTGGNRFCGPAAIAAITGCTPQEAADRLAPIINRHAAPHRRRRTGDTVRSTTALHLKVVLAQYAFHLIARKKKYRRETFRNWANRTEGWRRDRIFLVLAGRHWRVVHGWRTVCGQRRTPCHTNSAVTPGSIVKEVYEISAFDQD